jgi:hypothetical protein
MGCAQPVEEFVHTHSLAVNPGSAKRDGADQVTVVIPLEVGDVMVAQERVEMAEQIVTHLGATQIEYELVASEHKRVTLIDERPIRMLAIEIGIRVDHFGFDPDPEVHSQPTDMIDQRSETVRPCVGRHPPITKAPAIVTAAAEPAVVQHEQFDTNAGGGIGQRQQGGQIMIEVHGLPGVEVNRPRGGWVTRTCS